MPIVLPLNRTPAHPPPLPIPNAYEPEYIQMVVKHLTTLALAEFEPATNQYKRKAGTVISEIVVHDTGSTHPFHRTRKYLANPGDGRGVSIHYLIGREYGQFVFMVPEDKKAIHGGTAHNNKSIGIELWRHKKYKGDFSVFQYWALSELVFDLMYRHQIPIENVIGHGFYKGSKRGEPHGFRWDHFEDELSAVNRRVKAHFPQFQIDNLL